MFVDDTETSQIECSEFIEAYVVHFYGNFSNFIEKGNLSQDNVKKIVGESQYDALDDGITYGSGNDSLVSNLLIFDLFINVFMKSVNNAIDVIIEAASDYKNNVINGTTAELRIHKNTVLLSQTLQQIGDLELTLSNYSEYVSRLQTLSEDMRYLAQTITQSVNNAVDKIDKSVSLVNSSISTHDASDIVTIMNGVKGLMSNDKKTENQKLFY